MKKLVLYVMLLAACMQVTAQEPAPYAAEMAAFRAADSASFPEKNQILLIGSSSFTIWKDVNDYFPGYRILNRAFGGSTLPDVIRYVDKVVYPYNPRQILVYCGENDVAASGEATGPVVFERFKTLYSLIRKKYPAVPVYYVSMKPSPSRQMMQDRVREGNRLIKNWLAKQKHAGFIDVYGAMLDDEGKPKQEIFLDDNLHMNNEGYKIWQKILLPYLIK